MNYNSKTIPGSDYTRPLRDMLPDIIGKRSKTAQQIAKASGRRPQSVRNVLDRLHDKKAVHIKRWIRGNSGPWIACFFWGGGKDAPRPAAQERSVIHKRYRQSKHGSAVCGACRDRWRKSERGQEYTENYNKARWAREKFSAGGLVAIDPLLAAIMGR